LPFEEDLSHQDTRRTVLEGRNTNHQLCRTKQIKTSFQTLLDRTPVTRSGANKWTCQSHEQEETEARFHFPKACRM